MSTPGIRVLGYRPAAAWVERLRAGGYAVDVRPLRAPADLKAIGEDPPAAVAIDLSRGPSQGRVDFKICAVDEDWSGLLFSRRKK